MSSPKNAGFIKPALQAFVVFVILILSYLIINSLPRYGSVSGSVTENHTGAPIAHAYVSIRLVEDYSDRTGNRSIQTDDTPPVEPAITVWDPEAPYGWTQGSSKDNDELPGKMGETMFYARTDKYGKFSIQRVPIGKYHIEVSRRGYEGDDNSDEIEVNEDQNTDFSINMDRSKPELSFTETSSWLPTEDVVAGLHGNVAQDELKLSLDRADLDFLTKKAPEALVSTNGSEIASLPAYTHIKSWTTSLKNTDHAGDFYQRLHLGVLPEGIYKITASSQGLTAVGYAVVTHIGLIRKSYHNNLLAYVVDLKTGVPIPDIDVHLYAKQEKANAADLLTVKTDPEGLVRMQMPNTAKELRGVLLARQGDAVAGVSLELNSPGESEFDNRNGGSDGDVAYSQGALRSYIYTDRPIYRPGHTVYFKGIARWFSRFHSSPAFVTAGEKSPYLIPNNQPVTIDITDGRDNRIAHQTLHTNDMGAWDGSLILSSEALTGEYTITANLGGQTTTQTFVVAAYRKPEFEVKIDFDKPRYIRGDTIQATVTAKYYYGAPLAKGQLHYFGMYNDDLYDDSSMNQTYRQPENPKSASDSGSIEKSGDILLDDNGQAIINIPTKVDRDNSQDATFNLSVDVTDTSKRTVSESKTVDVGQGEFSIDITSTPYCAVPNSPISVSLHTKGPADKPLPNQPMELVTAFSDWDNGHEKLSGIHTQNITTDNMGAASLSVTAPHTGLFIIRAKATDKRGNAIKSEDTVWVSSANSGELPVKYPDLAILLDKPKYKIGDKAKVLINTDKPGPTALLTIEGATLYRVISVPLKSKSTSVEIDVLSDYSPGVSVSVCEILDKHYRSSRKDLEIDDTRRVLNIAINSDKPAYHPGDTASISVKTTDAQNNPVSAEVSIGVVDKAIYAIKEDITTSIVDAMLPGQGNVVNTDYSCPEVYLGDVDKGNSKVKLRTNFKDTALWLPDVRTDGAGIATVNLALPDNLTTWRITSVGQSRDNQFGKTTNNIVVNKDLVVRLELPRFLVSGDNAIVKGVVNNNTTNAVNAVAVFNPGILGKKVQLSINVPANGSISLDFPISAKGIAESQQVNLEFSAKASDALNDGISLPLPLLPHAVVDHVTTAGSLVHFVDKDLAFNPKAIPAESTLRVRLSPTVSSTLIPAWEYLSDYPYGSTDNVASILLGNLAVEKASSGSAAIFTLSAERKKVLADQIDRSIRRLVRYQRDDGGWAWFETGTTELWMTNIAVWALQQAQESGHPVPASVLDAGIKAIEKEAREHPKSPNDAYYGHAYGIATMALSGYVLAKAQHSAGADYCLKYLQSYWPKDDSEMTYADLSLMILTSHMLGGQWIVQSDSWLKQLIAGRTRMGALAAWTKYPHTVRMGSDQEKPDMQATVWAMDVSQALSPNDPNLDSIARWIMVSRQGDHWCDPFTTAMTLGVLSGYMMAQHEMQPNFDAVVTVGNKPIKTIHFGAESIYEPEQVVDIPGSDLTAKSVKVHLEKIGQGRLYYSLDLRQNIAAPPPLQEPGFLTRCYNRIWHPERFLEQPTASGYHIKRVYFRNTSRRNFLWEDTVPAPDTDYKQDDDIIVRLIIDATRASSHLIVEEPVPAGCEISEVSGNEEDYWSNWWSYTDVRDDKIVFFIGDLTRGRHEIDYHIRCATPGKFDIMPSSLTGSFDQTLHELGRTSHIDIQ